MFQKDKVVVEICKWEEKLWEGVPNTDVTRSIPFLPQPTKLNHHRNEEEGESEKMNNFGNTWTFNTSDFWKSESS